MHLVAGQQHAASNAALDHDQLRPLLKQGERRIQWIGQAGQTIGLDLVRQEHGGQLYRFRVPRDIELGIAGTGVEIDRDAGIVRRAKPLQDDASDGFVIGPSIGEESLRGGDPPGPFLRQRLQAQAAPVAEVGGLGRRVHNDARHRSLRALADDQSGGVNPLQLEALQDDLAKRVVADLSKASHGQAEPGGGDRHVGGAAGAKLKVFRAFEIPRCDRELGDAKAEVRNHVAQDEDH